MHVIGAAQHPYLAVPDGDADPLGLGGRPRWLGVPIAGTMGRVSNTRGAAHTAQPQLSRTHPPPIAGAAAAAALLPSSRPPPPRSPPAHHPITGGARVMHATHLEEESCGARRRRRELRRRRNTLDSDSPRFSPRTALPAPPAPPAAAGPLDAHSRRLGVGAQRDERARRPPRPRTVRLGRVSDTRRPHALLTSRSSLPPLIPPSRRRLPFDVDGLKDLCSRNPNIPKVYSKCARETARMQKSGGDSPAVTSLTAHLLPLQVQARRVRLPRLEHSRAPHSPTHSTQPFAAQTRSLLAPHRCSPPAPGVRALDHAA